MRGTSLFLVIFEFCFNYVIFNEIPIFLVSFEFCFWYIIFNEGGPHFFEGAGFLWFGVLPLFASLQWGWGIQHIVTQSWLLKTNKYCITYIIRALNSVIPLLSIKLGEYQTANAEFFSLFVIVLSSQKIMARFQNLRRGLLTILSRF